MRQNAGVDHAAKPLLHAPCYYAKAEALQINERSRELCSAAAKISRSRAVGRSIARIGVYESGTAQRSEGQMQEGTSRIILA